MEAAVPAEGNAQACMRPSRGISDIMQKKPMKTLK